jgi:hypothetical protein
MPSPSSVSVIKYAYTLSLSLGFAVEKRKTLKKSAEKRNVEEVGDEKGAIGALEKHRGRRRRRS